MHEERLLRELRGELERIARREGAERILEVEVWIGALSHVPAAALRDRWAEVVRGTAAEGSELRVERGEDPADPRATEVVLRNVRLRESSPAPPQST